MNEQVKVSFDNAIDRLIVHNDRVHTYRSSGMFLLGADWDLDAVRKVIEKHGVEEAGEFAKAMNHGLVVFDETGPLFFESREQE
jgi:hypothetical protein